MDPSRVAGAVANGRAMEGPALAQAEADGDPPVAYRESGRKGAHVRSD